MLPTKEAKRDSRCTAAPRGLLLLVGFSLLACSSGGGGATATGGAGGGSGGTGSGGTVPGSAGASGTGGTVASDPDAIVGSFNVTLVEATDTAQAQTKIIGVVRDGPQ